MGPGPPISYPCTPIDSTRLHFARHRFIFSERPSSRVQLEEQKMGEMSDMMDTATESGDKYFLREQELWESLGFDWEGWNATVEKILQQKPAQSRSEQE